ncbi:MAG: hypothetical protein U1F57_04385 [bacterium]
MSEQDLLNRAREALEAVFFGRENQWREALAADDLFTRFSAELEDARSRYFGEEKVRKHEKAPYIFDAAFNDFFAEKSFIPCPLW